MWFSAWSLPLKTKLQIFGAKANSGTRCAGPAGVRSHLEATLKERNDSKSYLQSTNVYRLKFIYPIYINPEYIVNNENQVTTLFEAPSIVVRRNLVMHSSLIDLAPNVRWSKTLMKKVWNPIWPSVASDPKDLLINRNIPFLLHILISPVVRNQPTNRSPDATPFLWLEILEVARPHDVSHSIKLLKPC